MKIYLVRHGETEYNRTKRIMGQMSTPMNEKGIKQAEILADALQNRQIKAIHSSDLKRATQTSDIISSKLDLPFETHEELREHGVGNLEGVTWADEFEDMTLHEFDKLMVKEGGERTDVFVERVWDKFLEIIKQYEQEDTILIVTHGGCIRVIIMKIMQTDEEIFNILKQDNCCINIVHYHKDKEKHKFQIEIINDCSHMKK